MKKYLPILVIIGVIILIWWIATTRRAKGGLTPGYRFFRWQDNPGGDLIHIPELEGNIPGLKQACSADPQCVGFNTAGFLKNQIDPNSFTQHSGYPDWAGLYVKNKVLRS